MGATGAMNPQIAQALGSLLGGGQQGGLGGIQAGQNPGQTPPTTSMLNSYNYNPYQQNQTGSMDYGMMNQLMAKMMNPQAMQNPMANPMFTTGAGYQPPQMQPNFNYGVNMAPIAGQPSPYGFSVPVAPKKTDSSSATLEANKKKRREEGGNK